MDVGDGFNFSFEQQSGNSLSCQSLPMFSAQRPGKFVGTTKSLMSVRKESSSPMTTPCSSADVAEQFLVTDWNPLVSVDQNVDFDGSGGLSSYNVRIPQSQGNNNSNTMVEQFQRSATFNNESIPEAVNSFDLLKSSQISSALCPPDFRCVNKHGIEKSIKGEKRKSMSECAALPSHSSQNSVQQKNVPPESVESLIEKDEKKQKTENPGGTSPKPTKEFQDGDTPNDDYIHVRAKRGQATNSHSLAERLRREKISERMKLLQDLVPGCSKITGKAMMLDEIINYVQSLQRQVEFLSMKLAAVNPELHFDIEQILSNNVLHSQEGSSAIFGCGSRINTFHPHLPPQGIVQPEMLMCITPNSGDMMRSDIPQLFPMAQLSGVWDDDLQTVLQMGFIPDPHLSGSDPNGSTKMEL